MRNALFITLTIVLTAIGTASAAIPGADDPNAYTRWSYYRDLLAFNRRTTLDVYKQVGHHDAKWDEHANALLDGCAKRMSEGKLPVSYRSGVPPIQELVAHVKPITEAGCDDPLVLDMCAVVCMDFGR